MTTGHDDDDDDDDGEDDDDDYDDDDDDDEDDDDGEQCSRDINNYDRFYLRTSSSMHTVMKL